MMLPKNYLLPGMPLSVEMPAPVITMRHFAAFTTHCRHLISSPSAGLQTGTNWEEATVEACRFNCNTVSYTICTVCNASVCMYVCMHPVYECIMHIYWVLEPRRQSHW